MTAHYIVDVDPRTPVIIGSGQVSVRSTGLDDARSPRELMAEAIALAIGDAGLASLPDPDLLAVVNLLSWRCPNPAALVAASAGLLPRRTGLTPLGGNAPITLLLATCGHIQTGQMDLAVLVGGEASRARRLARAAGTALWPEDADVAKPDVTFGDDFALSSPEETRRGIVWPVQIYPLFETALRASAGRSLTEHTEHISELWSRFAAVAADNPYAAIRSKPDALTIATPGPNNRMINWPYPKLMNSNFDVDQSAGVIVCSVERAAALGVPRDRWVFPLAGAESHEHPHVSNRWTYTETPAVRLAAHAALRAAGLGIDDVELLDLYSCFPSAVQLGAAALGVDINRQLTRTGGLSFAGGPWNNYSMHGLAAMATDLRERPGATGLVWANGGYVTKHAITLLSTTPPAHGFRSVNPQAAVDELPTRMLAEPDDAAGPAVVEAYSVAFGRSGEPEKTLAACLLADGRRAWGTSSDPTLSAAMTETEWVGCPIELNPIGELQC